MTTGAPPPMLRCEVDGGSENWNKTFFTFMAYLVGTGVYTNTHVIRLPRWHTENDCDQSMQAMSVLSHGNSNINSLRTTGERNRNKHRVRKIHVNIAIPLNASQAPYAAYRNH